MRHIKDIAARAGISEKYVEYYGNYKAKISPDIMSELNDRNNGKLIFVSAITATPFGEGKTVTSIGLTEALGYIGKKVHLCLREPSLGPVFGVKGGATGTGKASILPADEINLHFTGDIHAVGAANNLLAAIIDNHVYHNNEPKINPQTITWRRVLDISDRQLRSIICGLGGKANGYLRETGFDITVASEIMAILALSKNMADLKERLGKILIGYSHENKPVFARELNCVGAMAALLKDAIKPNIVQTYEEQPAFVHAGPFANIAHGNSSVIATKMALKLADFVITEGGFAVDLGAQKFFDIVCRQNPDIRPAAVVIVASLKALKMHGGMSKDLIKTTKDLKALEAGMVNLKRHVETVKMYGLPVVIAVNRFPDDCYGELCFVKEYCEKELSVRAEISNVVEEGGAGGEALADAVIEAAETKSEFKLLYGDNLTIKEKIEQIAKKVYRAGKVSYSIKAEKDIAAYEKSGFSDLAINIAKTQLSTTDTPNIYGAPEGFTFNVREVKPSLGAGFLVVIAGEMMTLPGLPKVPSANMIDIDDNGNITGLH
ncbi:MAG: formate--tetrahydrofolate ligase [Candidatus Wallbacteria bacterium]